MIETIQATRPIVSAVCSRCASAAGFTFVECLIALLVISVGLLGLIQAQWLGLDEAKNQYHRMIAINVADDEFLLSQYASATLYNQYRHQGLSLLPSAEVERTTFNSNGTLQITWQASYAGGVHCPNQSDHSLQCVRFD